MTDRELLESLGYVFPSDGFAYNFTAELIADKLSNATFWLELDTELAKQGWATTIDQWDGVFDYKAVKPESRVVSVPRTTRNAAVREVYEQIMQAKQERKGGATDAR